MQETSLRLNEMARSLHADAKLPGVRELSAMFNVSIMTVRQAVALLESRGVLYQQQGSGIYVSSKRDQRHIVMLTDYSQIRSPSHSPVWDIVADMARQRTASQRETFQFFTANILDRPDEPVPPSLLQLMREGRVHGILGAGAHEISCQWLKNQSLPFVAWGSAAHGTVNIHYSKGVRMGVRALAEHGCQRIALWQSLQANLLNSPEYNEHRKRTLQAFKAELNEVGLEFDERLMQGTLPPNQDVFRVTQQSLQEQGYRIGLQVFDASQTSKSTPRPDGIVITDDMMTSGAIAAFHNLNVQYGNKVQLATFTNKGSVALLGYEHKLFRLQVDPEQIVGSMFNMLETLMNGDELKQRNKWLVPKLFILQG